MSDTRGRSGTAEVLYREEVGQQVLAWRPDNRHVVVQLGGTVAWSNSNLYELDLSHREGWSSSRPGPVSHNSPSVSGG